MIFCCLSAGFQPDVYPTCIVRTNMYFHGTLIRYRLFTLYLIAYSNPHEPLTTLNRIPLWGTKERIHAMNENHGDCEGVDLHHT